MTEVKQKNELAQTEFCFIQTSIMLIINIKGRQLPDVLRLYISVALQQKTANFKAAFPSRAMQWSVTTEEKQKDELVACKQ